MPWTKKDSAPPVSKKTVWTTKVVKAERLRQGGKLIIIPFTAGPGVAATDELDRIVLRVIKGIIDVMGTEQSPIEVVTSASKETADLLMKGNVIELTEPGGFGKWLRFKKDLSLGIDGQIVDQKTGDTVLVFSKRKKGKPAEGGYYALGEQIGQEIGQFIISSTR